MRKLVPVILAASLFAAYGQFAAARGGGGGGGSAAGGSHMSSQAQANSNGRFASDRDTGLDRAEDRMNAEGKAHEQATEHAKKRHHKTSARREHAATPATPTTR